KLGGELFDEAFGEQALTRVAQAVRRAAAKPMSVTHAGAGSALVEKVASSRRVLGANGRIEFARMSSCRNEAARAAPEGMIDPNLRLITFWQGERPLAALSYYATHPQSYYGKGGVSADFVGMARAMREAALPNVAHIHFNGPSGNVAAGKYNDGAPENRPVLAARLAAGMQRAWDATRRFPVTAADLRWVTTPVTLPSRVPAESALLADLDNTALKLTARLRSARDLAWLERLRAAGPIQLSMLRLGKLRVLHMPGELFVEYQLAAQKMRPADFVAMAAYGDLGPGYIGTAIAYTQGGYETGPVSRVAAGVESVLMSGMRQLLK
ncbi:MAG: hypothetical protein ABIZ80_08760, partial [Bryobacteraceae bacterium]